MLNKLWNKERGIEDTLQKAVLSIKQIESTNGVKVLKELMMQLIQIRKLCQNITTHRENRHLKAEMISVAKKLKKKLSKEKEQEINIS